MFLVGPINTINLLLISMGVLIYHFDAMTSDIIFGCLKMLAFIIKRRLVYTKLKDFFSKRKHIRCPYKPVQ
jgi:hypothetical protein